MTPIFVFDREINLCMIEFLKKRYLEESSKWFYDRSLEVNRELLGELVLGEMQVKFINELFYTLDVVHMDNFFNKLLNHGVNVILEELNTKSYVGGNYSDGFYVRLNHVISFYYNLFGCNKFVYERLIYTQEYYDSVNLMLKLLYDYSVRIIHDYFDEYAEVLSDMIVKTMKNNFELVNSVCCNEKRINFDINLIDFKPVIIVRSKVDK